MQPPAKRLWNHGPSFLPKDASGHQPARAEPFLSRYEPPASDTSTLAAQDQYGLKQPGRPHKLRQSQPAGTPTAIRVKQPPLVPSSSPLINPKLSIFCPQAAEGRCPALRKKAAAICQDFHFRGTRSGRKSWWAQSPKVTKQQQEPAELPNHTSTSSSTPSHLPHKQEQQQQCLPASIARTAGLHPQEQQQLTKQHSSPAVTAELSVHLPHKASRAQLHKHSTGTRPRGACQAGDSVQEQRQRQQVAAAAASIIAENALVMQQQEQRVAVSALAGSSGAIQKQPEELKPEQMTQPQHPVQERGGEQHKDQQQPRIQEDQQQPRSQEDQQQQDPAMHEQTAAADAAGVLPPLAQGVIPEEALIPAAPAAAPPVVADHELAGGDALSFTSSWVPGLCWNAELLGYMGGGGCADIWLANVRSGSCIISTLSPEHRTAADTLLAQIPGKITVALKLIKPQKQPLAALEQEASFMSTMHRVNEDYFVRPYDQGVISKPGTDQDGRGWIMMEFLSEGSLLHYVKGLPPVLDRMPPERVRGVMRQVAEALSLCHKEGIVHRDVKAANVLVADKVRLLVKLSDFGVARTLPTGMKGSTRVGTPGWMAYEVEVSEPDDVTYHDYSCDTSSFGCMMLEVIYVGRHPFRYLHRLDLTKEEVDKRKANKVAELDMPDSPYNSLLPLEQEFLRLCLQSAPERRPTITPLMEHPYLSGEVPL